MKAAAERAQPFWDGLRKGELLLLFCGDCQGWHSMAPSRCPRCSSCRLQWKRASGRGSLLAFTSVHRAPRPDLRQDLPYTLGLIALQEGPQIMARIVGKTPRVASAMKIAVLSKREPPLLAFRSTQAAGS